MIGAGISKGLSKHISNNKTNRIFTKINLIDTKVGRDSFKKITKDLYSLENNYISQIINEEIWRMYS